VAHADRNLPVQEGDDPIGGVNALTYGISNQILWRGANKEGQALVNDFLRFRLCQSTFFNPSSMGLDGIPQHHHPFSDFWGETEFRPLHQVTFGMNLGVSPYSEGFDRSDFRFILLDEKGQNYLNVNYIFIKDYAKQINVETYLNLLQSVKTWVTYAHTFTTTNQLEKRYGLILQRQCWGVDLTYTDQPGNRRIGFTVFIPGMGEKAMRSPMHFPAEAKTKESPDLF
jgi:LPS-assembly protein